MPLSIGEDLALLILINPCSQLYFQLTFLILIKHRFPLLADVMAVWLRSGLLPHFTPEWTIGAGIMLPHENICSGRVTLNKTVNARVARFAVAQTGLAYKCSTATEILFRSI